MATTPSATPSLLPAFLALLIVILFGYLLYSDLRPSSRTEHTLSPPIEIIETPEQPPLTIINEATTQNSEEIITKEAHVFVENLSPKTENPIAINEYNDKFVRPDSIISLSDLEHRDTSIQDLLLDENLADDTPVTLSFSHEDYSQTTLAELALTIEDHNESITIVTVENHTLVAPLADLLLREDLDKTAPITLILTQQHSVKTRFGEIAKLDIPPSQSLTATISHSVKELSVKDIIPDHIGSDNTLFYLHRVTEKDSQGLWGIIQSGLIDKFRQGLQLDGISQNKDLIQAVIPVDADEKLASGLSSFLGKILTSKVDSSYIYNFKTQAIGFDANIIHPGQQIVLINFSPEEITQIYQFFSDKRNQGTHTFAISD